MLSDAELRRLARDVRSIRNQTLFPAVAKLGCLGLFALPAIGLFGLAVLIRLIRDIGQVFAW